MKEQNGENHIVEMIAEDMGKLRDIRSFNFDPLTYLTVKGTHPANAEEVSPKYL